MKKKTMVLMLMPLVGGLTFGSTNVNAADPATKEAKSKAEFELTEPTNGTITVTAQNLNFGQKALSSEDLNLDAKDNMNINVTEFSGRRPGWKLTVKMDKFTTSGGKVGTDIKLFYPQVTPKSGTVGATSNPPISLGNDNSLDGKGNKGVAVSDDNAPTLLAQASVGKGYGKWDFSYDDLEGHDNLVQIHIPTGQQVGAYSTTLTYAVEDTP